MASLTEQAVRISLKKLIHDNELARDSTLTLLDDMYEGGLAATRHLTQFPGENPKWWAHRRTHAVNVPYFGMLVDYIRDAALGTPPNITMEQEAYQDRFEEILYENDWDNVHSDAGLGCILHGSGWLRIGPDPEAMTVAEAYPRIMRVHTGNIKAWYSRMSGRLIRVIEQIGMDNGETDRGNETEHEFISTTDETIERYDKDGELVESKPNPYRVINYVELPGRHDPNSDEGSSYVLDAARMQVLFNQDSSYFQRILLLHSGSTLVTKGYNRPEIDLGVLGHIAIDDPTGDASFLQPQSKILEFKDVLAWIVETMYQSHRVPTSIISGAVQESGIALEIKWRPMTQQAMSIRTRVTPAYETLAELVAVVDKVETHNGPGVVKASVEFQNDILPTDTRSEREEDRMDWESGLMTDDEYLMKWGPERVRDDAEARAAYIEELEAKRQSKRDSQNAGGLQSFADLLTPEEATQAGETTPGGIVLP